MNPLPNALVRRNAVATAVCLALQAYSSAGYAQSVLDLSPSVAAAPGILAGSNPTLANIANTNLLTTHLLISNQIGQFNTLLIHTDLIPTYTNGYGFAINQPLVVASLPDSLSEGRYLGVMNNLIFQGKNRSNDVVYLYSEAYKPGDPMPGGPISADNGRPYNYYLTSLTINQSTLLVADPLRGTNPFFNGVVLNSLRSLVLNDGAFSVNQGTAAGLNISYEGLSIVAASGDNLIRGTTLGAAPSLQVLIRSGSALTIDTLSELGGEVRSHLTMEPGSRLNILGSAVTLQGTDSTITGASLRISGAWVPNDAAHLKTTQLTVRDSDITLEYGGYLRAYQPGVGNFARDSQINFFGTNTLNMNDISWVSTSKNNSNLAQGDIYVRGGVTTFSAQSGNPRILTENLHVIEGGHLKIEGGVRALDGRPEGGGTSPTNLIVLDSRLSLNSPTEIHLNTLRFERAVIAIEYSEAWHATAFNLKDTEFTVSTGASKLANASFVGSTPTAAPMNVSGTTTFKLKLSATPVEVAPGSGFYRSADTVSLQNIRYTGLGNTQFLLGPLTPGLSASAYASGGNNRDGVYNNLLYVGTGATTDTDTPAAIKLDASMPALLTVTQVKNPSTDGEIAIKLTETPVTALQSHVAIATPNQSAAANLLIQAATSAGSGSGGSGSSGSGSGNATVTTALKTVTTGQLAQGLQTLHPELYSSNMTVALSQIDMIMNTVLSHTSPGAGVATGSRVQGSDLATGRYAWADASDVRGTVNAQYGLSGFGYRLSSLTLGTQLLQTNNQTLGGFLSIAHHKTTSDELMREDISGRAVHAGAYWYGINDSGFTFRSVAGLGHGSHQSVRAVDFAGLGGTHNAQFSSHSAYLGMKVGRVLYKDDSVTITPEAGAVYSYYRQSSVRESGDPLLSLLVKPASAQSVVTSVGMNARFSSLSQTQAIQPVVMLNYLHDWYARKNRAHSIDAAMAVSPGYTQSFVGQNRGPDMGVIGVGLVSEISSALQVNGGLVYSLTSNGHEWGLGINASYRW